MKTSTLLNETTSFYKISHRYREESPEETALILNALFKQKLRNQAAPGIGNTPDNIINMPMYEYISKLQNIHRLLSRRLRHLIQTISASATATSHEDRLSHTLRRLCKGLRIEKQCLILNHLTDLYLPDYSLVIEVNGSIHDQGFKMNQDQYKADSLARNFKINTSPVENGRITSYANALSLNIKNGTLRKNDYRRSKKIERDILIETISYWISAKDLHRLLTIDDLNSVSFKTGDFSSKILHTFEGLATYHNAA